MKKIYLFDLDSTITKGEILPTIAKKIGKEDEMQELTEQCMIEDIPFKDGLKKRMRIVENIPVSEINNIILEIPLNDKLMNFITEHKEDCYIVSGSVDTYIEKFMIKYNMQDHFYSSKATVENNKIKDIVSVVDKGNIAQEFKNNSDCKIIAVGDGSNDVDMVKAADVGIAFGGVRKIAPSLLKAADYATYSEEELCDLLNNI